MSDRVVSDVQLELKARAVYLVQQGRGCCKWLVKLSFIDIISEVIENTYYVRRENGS